MKAIAITQAAADGNNIPSLTEIDLPVPTAHGRDLLVAVKAISVNPVDTKVRAGFQGDTPRVLGWDAVGVVQTVGEEVTLFAPGDEVWYAGALGRAGSNSEYQLVDERLVAHKPRTLDNAAAAALPLTAITAWELLFHRLGVKEGGNAGDTLLIVGAAGGVGSILTQLASKLTAMTVIGTASRPESQQWVREAGAHHVIDHSKPLANELARIGISAVTHVASLTNTEQHFNALIDALAPQGKLALIDDPETLDVVPLKAKSLSLHWEFMFTRSMFETDDMIAQHQLLTRVAALIDSHTIKTTLGEHYGAITAANLQKAHRQLETGRAVGKIVLEGFYDDIAYRRAQGETGPDGRPAPGPAGAAPADKTGAGQSRLRPVSAARRAGHLLHARGVAGTGRPRCACRDALFSGVYDANGVPAG